MGFAERETHSAEAVKDADLIVIGTRGLGRVEPMVRLEPLPMRVDQADQGDRRTAES